MLNKYYWGDKINEDEMGRVCSMYGGRDMHTGFWCGSLKERDLLEDQLVEGSILLKLIIIRIRGRGLELCNSVGERGGWHWGCVEWGNCVTS